MSKAFQTSLVIIQRRILFRIYHYHWHIAIKPLNGPAKALLVIPTEPKGAGCVKASKESCGSHDGYGSTRVMITGGSVP